MGVFQHSGDLAVSSLTRSAGKCRSYQDLQRSEVAALQRKLAAVSPSNSLDENISVSNEPAPTVTVVSPVADYLTDPRCFLGVMAFPPADVIKAIKVIQAQLIKADPNQFVIPEKAFHLTVKNIRTVTVTPNYTVADLDKIKGMLSKIVPQYPQFYAEGEGLLIMPTSISIPVYTPKIFADLAMRLDQELRRIGVPDNKQYSSKNVLFMNITIMRFTQPPNAQFYKCLDQFKNIELPKFQIDELRLLSSNIAFSPPYYQEFGRYSLG